MWVAMHIRKSREYLVTFHLLFLHKLPSFYVKGDTQISGYETRVSLVDRRLQTILTRVTKILLHTWGREHFS